MKIKIKKGNWRTVLIVFDVLVFKFPKTIAFLRDFFSLLTIFLWGLLTFQSPNSALLKLSLSVKRAFYMRFLRGFRQNLDEFAVWRKTRANFLTSTYLTLGIMNIQKFQEGDDLTLAGDSKEISQVFQSINEATYNRALAIDPHCFSPANFKRTARGYKIVDYGRGGEGGLSFPAFIQRWHEEIAAVLCQPPE